MVAPALKEMHSRKTRSKSPRRTKSSSGIDVVHAGKSVVVEQQQDRGPSTIFECMSTGIYQTPTQINRKKPPLHHSAPSHQPIVDTLSGWVYAIFLPEGFPQSVSQDYLPYQIWDTVQAFCSTITGILAQRAMLTGMGVGNDAAKVTAALWQTTVRRNIGKVGRITFTTFKGTDLDSNSKTWRIVADILNDLAMAIEIVSPMLCVATTDCNTQWNYFVWVCAAEVFRSIVGVAGGASRAALTQHFSLRDNFGDVNAKDGSQEMFVEILGSGVGMLVSDYALEADYTAKWSVFLLFTILHVVSNVMACRSVCLLTFNRQRAHLVVEHWLRRHKILHPQDVSRRERVLFWGGSDVPGVSITLGATVTELAACGDVVEMIQRSEGGAYVVCEAINKRRWLGGSVQRQILIGLSVGASQADILRAYMHASILARGVPPATAAQVAAELVDGLAPAGWTRALCHVSPSNVRLRWPEQ